MRTLTNLLVALLCLCSSPAASAKPLFQEGEFTDEDLLVASKMAVLEGGWKNLREHDAMAFVQLNRWRANMVAYPHYRDQVVAYCPGLRLRGKKRRIWISELTLEGTRPPTFPKHLTWDKHQRWWLRVVHNMRKWSEGKSRDPHRGRAWHWRSPDDPPTTARGLRQIEGFNNIYYGRRVRCGLGRRQTRTFMCPKSR